LIDRSDAPGLYVHVPFCKTKCPYCDFYSSTSGADVPRWLSYLAREISLYSGMFSHFDTVYLGGGTPSLLGEHEISILMNAVTSAFHIAGDSEITIELNPDDVTPSKLSVYRDLGINRISLGVQSLCDAELRFLGRRHNANRALDAIHEIRDAGFDNLGIDLIYGFAGQGIASWERTLRRALDLSPEHISCYQMTIEHDTPFGRMRAEGSIREPDEELQRRFFVTTGEFLHAHGYIHYEISNFARGESLIARHNSKYWRHVPYLGLGPAAHSFRENRRWWNVRSVADYCRAIENGKVPVTGAELLEPGQIELEKIYLGLRTRDGVDLELVSRNMPARRALRRLQKESLVQITGGRAAPTPKGFLVADELPLLFF